MIRYFRHVFDNFRKGDMILLLLCLITTAFGCLVIASATNSMGSLRFVVVQLAAAVIGVILYAVMSSIDADVFTEHRWHMVVFNVLLLLMLYPFGTDNGTGNRSWLDFKILPFNIQPAEICKITFILILASVMGAHQSKISSLRSIGWIALELSIMVGVNMMASHDMGVSLIFVFTAIVMVFAGGVSMLWFVAGAILIAAAIPIAWTKVLSDYQKLRIQILIDPSIDAAGTGPRYHTMQSMKTLTGGGMTGQGLFHGHRTQHGALCAQHTDYIFATIGEELGFIGCVAVIVIMLAIIVRVIWVGTRSEDYTRRLICFGSAAALMFQVIINVGMCVGVMPVIGLTLPFISYGGSSLVSLYAMLGMVSGVYARPTPTSQERYIRPPYMTRSLL